MLTTTAFVVAVVVVVVVVGSSFGSLVISTSTQIGLKSALLVNTGTRTNKHK